MTATVFEARSLSVIFPTMRGPLLAVRDVNFDLFRGETLALVGESGSGKSVTANAMLQLIDQPGRIAGGQLLLRDGDIVVDIAGLPPDSRSMRDIRARRISMVFQEPLSALSPVHRCGSQVVEKLLLAEPELASKEARARVIELFRMVELPRPTHIIERYPFELSGGQRQRVVIAMAIASSPDILIADEPTTALDVTTQAKVLELLKRLQHDLNMAMLFVTHDMNVIAQIADRVLVMRDGQTIEVGSVPDLFNAPQHPYTIELLAATRRFERPAATKAPYEGAAPVVLDVHDVGKTFLNKRSLFSPADHIVALENVSLTLHSSESLGVVGESGSGKSTLLRCLLGLDLPTTGKAVYVNDIGQEVELGTSAMHSRAALLDLRMIFQDPWSSLDPRMTVYNIVAEPLRLLRKDLDPDAIRIKVAGTLRRVGLDTSMLDRYPHAFSGGQRQRIVIARAIITDPRIIFADEATAALDMSLRAQILDLLLDIQRESGAAFLFVTHDIAAVRYFCDRVIVMRDGLIVESGPVEDVLENPQHPYTLSLIRAVCKPYPVVDPSVRAIEVVRPHHA